MGGEQEKTEMKSIFIIITITAIFTLAIYLKLNQAKIRGKLGETRVSLILKSLSDNYHSFNDVYIKRGNTSVQIDHIVISIYGIFVIETKNYTGWIYGSDKSEKWTKNMYGNKYYFQNPLIQNYYHIKALQDIFELSIDKFIPVVVFLRGATLKCKTHGVVIYSSQLKDLINSYTTQIMNTEDVERLTKLLISLPPADKELKKQHINRIREKYH